ncbi:MAG: tRNA epoxyqueuosine(34) reductase QueG [Pseudomonadota bacterium]
MDPAATDADAIATDEGQARVTSTAVLSAAAVRVAAASARFVLVGFARAEALDPGPLTRWLDAGHAADMDWMRRRIEERLDPRKVLPGAQTVIALGIPYRRPKSERSRVASYARGRDYHYAHRDRMRALRNRLLELAPGIETYACVDTGVAMEKAWAERAGLGFIGKNGLLINPTYGSWVTLSVMFLDRAVDAFDPPQPNLCGDCTRCLGACPTGAFPQPGVVDARRCIAYQSIENRDVVPVAIRRGFAGRVFGCDVCQDVCPFNNDTVPVGDRRFEPRPLSALTPAEMAALSEADFDRLAAGMALVRTRYDGFRRNALLALGAARDRTARDLVERLRGDPSALVSEAAVWALEQIDRLERRLAPA